jgi:arylsulfatase A-like enzyme
LEGPAVTRTSIKQKGDRIMARGVLFIVIDCLRWDHVSAYGYPRPTTPTIDALAGEGTLWERAYATSSWTKPSVTSFLTGLYPSQHGAFEGVKRSRGDRPATTDSLQNVQATLAERFAAAGWNCGAFINNAQLGEFTRLNRGFSAYAPMAGKADRLIGIFLEWLEGNAGNPFFAYLHFLEAHWPYKPRRRHVEMFGGNRDTNCYRDFSATDYGLLRRAVSRGQAELSPDQLTQMVQMYDGAVRRLDGKLKVILAMLTELGLRDDTAIVVTADHGDEFLDHATLGHGHTLYDELTHVPLIAKIPGQTGGQRIATPVSQTDLAETLLAIGGVDGVDATRDLRTPATKPIFGELRTGRRYRQTIRDGRWKLHREYKFEPTNGEFDRSRSPRQMMADCPHTTVYRLFDMESDPGETRCLADDDGHGEVLRRMIDGLDQWWWGLECPDAHDSGGETVIDDQVVQRLHDLGYIE